MDDIDQFLDEKPDDIDAFLDQKAPPDSSVSSPIAAAVDGLQRLNKTVTEAAVATAAPIAAPIDAAIKRVDERSALPKIETVQHTADGDVHGDLFPDLITQAAGQITGKLVDTALGDTPELVKRGVKDVTAGALQLGSGLGGAMRVMGFENMGQMIAKSAQQTAKELMPPDPNIVDQVAQGLGSMAAFMVPGLGVASSARAVAVVAPRLAMFLGTATSSVLEAGVEAGDVYNRVMEKTGDKTEANVAAGRAFFANLALIQYTNKLGWAGDQSSRASRALESFFTEGTQEGGQEFISNLTAHDPLMRGVVEAAFVGGIVGGVAGGAAHTTVRDIQAPEAPPTPPGAPPAAPVTPPAPSTTVDAPAPVPLNTAPIEPEAAVAPAEALKLEPPIPTPAEIAALPDESKITGEVYHGSPEKVLEGGVLKVGTKGLPVDGIFFSASKDEAAKYAKDGVVHTANVTIENPANDKILEKVRKGRNGAETRAELIRLGYDGVISEKMGDIIAFTQDQVKIVEESSDQSGPSEPVENVVAQLEKAGYEPKTARTLGVVFEGFRVLGDRAGIAAHKLFDRYGIKIVKGEASAAGQGKVLEQSGAAVPPFYSKLQKDVEAKVGKSATVEQVRALLKDQKEDEVKWSGIEDFLKDKTKVNKAELQDFLRANQLQVEEVEKGGQNGPEAVAKAKVRIDDIEREFRREGYSIAHADTENIGELDVYKGDKKLDAMDLPNQLEDLAREYANAHRTVAASEDRSGDNEDGTKFGHYTLPGGKNYRELLLTMPTSTLPEGWRVEEIDGKFHVINENGADLGGWNTRQDAERSQRRQVGGKGFFSSHFDEPNILAHVRFKDREIVTYNSKQIEDIGKRIAQAVGTGKAPARVDSLGSGAPAAAVAKGLITPLEAAQFAHAKGFHAISTEGAVERVLFIEEVQSDWHQKGRREGYNVLTNPRAEKVKGFDWTVFSDEYPHGVESEGRNAEQAIANAKKLLRNSKVPDAPFKKTWHEFALKRMVRYAAEHGYDKIAWTTGEQQAERYDLSKKVERITHSKNGDGTYNIHVVDKVGRDIYDRMNLSVPDVENLVGKDVSQKIVDREGEVKPGSDRSYFTKRGKAIGTVEKDRSWYIKWEDGSESGSYISESDAKREGEQITRDYVTAPETSSPRVLSGLDLKVGGEGMKGFYDKIVPSFMNKFGKKFGAEVGKTRFPRYVVDHGRGSESSTPGKEHDLELAEANAKSNNAKVADKSIVAHSMPITPAMKEAAVGEGFPMFQKSGGETRGRLRIQGRQFTIELLEGADLSTFLHETGHLYLEVLGDIASDPAASQDLKNDYAAILNWFGVKSREEIAVEHHEQFARGFEAYLMEGKAPTQRLQSAFESFKEWLGAIYKQLSALDVELTPEVRRVFDRMLASDEELKTELKAAEDALANARKRKNAADSQAPPESPQDEAPAAQAAVAEAEAQVKKVKAKAEPAAKQAKERPGDGARIMGVKRQVVEQLSEIGALIDSDEPMLQLKPAQLERFANAGLLDTNFRLTPLARKAVAELTRLKGLMKIGYVSDISISDPKKLTLKGFFKSIVDGGRFSLLNTFQAGWLTDGRIMFRTMESDAPVYALFKHMGEKFQQNPVNLDPIIQSAMKATDEVSSILGVQEAGAQPTYLLQTKGGRQMVVAAEYFNFFKERYPDAKLYAQGDGMALKVEHGGQLVGALMPMRVTGPFSVFNTEGEKTVVETSKGRLEVDAKMKEIQDARNKLEFNRKVHRENLKEIRQLDETPGEKTAALITKIAVVQKENIDLEDQMAQNASTISMLEEQAAALREQHGIEDVPVSGLVKKRAKGGKGGSRGASSGEFAYDTPVELGGMEHVKPFRMPELVRLAYELMGQAPTVKGMRAEKRGFFRGRGDGEIALNPIIFQNPEQAAKTLAHEIGHLTDYLPDHTLKRGNLLGSLLSIRSHLSNTFGTLQVTNKELRDELMAVTMYWRPYDIDSSTASYKAYRKSARELYADAISMLFNSPGTLERMAPKFYAGFFQALDAKPAVKLSFFQLQALLNSTEMEIQESRHLDRKAMYLSAEDLWAAKRKDQEARESHYGEWFKQLIVEKHQKAIGMVDAAASRGEMLPPSADPRYILEELSLADNANHAFLEEVDAKVVKPLQDSEVTLLDLGDYLYLSRVALGDRQAFANPKGYHPEEAKKAMEYMSTRLGSERYAKLEAAAAAFREIVFKMSEEAVAVGAYNQQVFDEKIKPNRGSYAVFAVQEHLEDYIAAGVKEQIGTLKDIANPFTATVMKMVALNKLIAKQKAANVMRDFLLSKGEAEKAKALNPQDNLVQFRQQKGKGLLELLENGHRVAYYVDPYIAEAFKKKDAGTFYLATKILDSVFNGVFRPLYITFNIGFQLYSNPIRDFARTRRNVYALVKNDGYTGTVKS